LVFLTATLSALPLQLKLEPPINQPKRKLVYLFSFEFLETNKFALKKKNPQLPLVRDIHAHTLGMDVYIKKEGLTRWPNKHYKHYSFLYS
jgi:hypothetical protein